MIRFLDLANSLTLTALACALACSLLALGGHLAYAAIALIVTGLCDLFDGFVARRLDRSDQQRQFGANLDSLVDGCAFGFAPVIMLYAAGLRSPFELLLLAFYAGCAIWRLAYFDTIGLQGESSARYYIGLPTTYVALIFPLVFMLGLLAAAWLPLALAIVTPIVSLAMISSLPIPKPGGRWYAFFLLLAVTMIAVLTTWADRIKFRPL